MGVGTLRVQAGAGTNQLILLSGPSRSHGHPDKLAVDLFAQGNVLMPIPGVIFPYDNPLDPKWYHTTLANCTLVVDEKSQPSFGSMYRFPRNQPPSEAIQLVFGPAATMGIQRAYSVTSYAGTTMDRAVFLTAEYFADLFGAFSETPHTYDLAWHIQGEWSSELKLKALTLPEPVADGYNALAEVRHAKIEQPWSAAFKRGDVVARFLAASGGATEVIVGKGHYRGDIGYSANDHNTLAVLQRRVTAKTCTAMSRTSRGPKKDTSRA